MSLGLVGGGVIARLVWGSLNWRLYFLWRLSRTSLEEKMSNVGRRPFGMVMQEDFFMEMFVFDGGRANLS